MKINKKSNNNITWQIDPDPRILERGGEERVELEIWEEEA